MNEYEFRHRARELAAVVREDGFLDVQYGEDDFEVVLTALDAFWKAVPLGERRPYKPEAP